MINLVLFYGCFAVCTINPIYAAGIGDDILQEIKTFSEDGLGISKFQNILKTLQTKSQLINENTAQKLATDINHQITTLSTLLKTMKDNLEQEYVNVQSTTSDMNCKDITTSYSNLVLGNNVDLSRWCITGEVLKTKQVGEFLPSSRLINNWKTKYNENSKSIKYIKYGDENGVLYNYPAKKLDTVYDNRFSSWYVETATPSLKDVVIAIDKSQSMDRLNALTIAKRIATTVIDTLNSNDRIAVIAFDQSPATLINGRNCYQNQLAKATDVNKEALTTFIKNIVTTSNSASFSNALKKAFSMFSNTDGANDQLNRKRTIMFITDGDTGESATDIYNTFKVHNQQLNNSVSIPTFGVGGAVQRTQMLYNLSEQTFVQGADVPRAVYTLIKEIDGTRASYFPQNTGSVVKFSVPYKDIFGTGLQISMCMSITRNSAFKGVFCFDIAIEYLLSDVTYFTDDDGAYAFIVDSQSRVLSHPMLPNIAQLAKESFFVYLSTVEIAKDIEFIQTGMASGNPGQKETTKLRILPRGTGGGQDIITQNKTQVTYYWHPVPVTKFTVCIVASKMNRLSLQWGQSLPQVWYHSDYKIPANNDKLCKAFNRIAAKETIAIAVTTACYDNPFNFAFFETPTVSQTTTFLRNSNSQNPGIKNGIRDMTAALFELEKIWQQATNTDFIVWRYFATGTGIMVTYPGLELPRTYDARVRGWFLGAMADKTKYYISTPYVDLWGAGIVITLVKASTQSNDFTVGVIAMDFTVTSFYYTLTRAISQCRDNRKTCIVINNAGFIVVHKDWIEQSTPDTELEDVHLVKKEKNIADTLIKEGILQPRPCIDMAKSFKQRDYWKISNNDIRSVDSQFDITAIPETNLYLIIKSGDSGELTDCDECKSDTCPGQKRCHCPCVRDANSYKYCTATLNTSIALPCAPKLPSLDFTPMLKQEREKIDALALSDCIDYNCESRNQQNCMGVLSCIWCTAKSNNEPLGTACEYCTRVENCPYGKQNKETKDKCKETTTASEDPWLKRWEFAIIFIFMLIIFAAVIIVVVIYFMRKLQNVQHDQNYNTIKLRQTVVPDDNGYFNHQRYINGANTSNIPMEEPHNNTSIPTQQVNNANRGYSDEINVTTQVPPNIDEAAVGNSLPNLSYTGGMRISSRPKSEHTYDSISQLHQPKCTCPPLPTDNCEYLNPFAASSGKDNKAYDPFAGLDKPQDNVQIQSPHIDNEVDIE